MSETISATRDASRNIWHALRCLWCEMLIGWAIKIAPADYTPSFVEVAAAMYRRGLTAQKEETSSVSREPS